VRVGAERGRSPTGGAMLRYSVLFRGLGRLLYRLGWGRRSEGEDEEAAARRLSGW